MNFSCINCHLSENMQRRALSNLSLRFIRFYYTTFHSSLFTFTSYLKTPLPSHQIDGQGRGDFLMPTDDLPNQLIWLLSLVIFLIFDFLKSGTILK